MYDALDTAEDVLVGELDSLSDSIDEPHCDGVLSTAISSSVASGVGTGQGLEGNHKVLGCCNDTGEGVNGR